MFIMEVCTLPRFTLTNLSPRTLFSHSASASVAGGLAGAICAMHNNVEIRGGTIEISNSSADYHGGAHGFVALGLLGLRGRLQWIEVLLRLF